MTLVNKSSIGTSHPIFWVCPLCIKTYVISGGLPPYTTPVGQPLLPLNPPNSNTASTTVACNNGLQITVVDSVGCTVVKNSINT